MSRPKGEIEHQGKDVEVISRGLIDAMHWREAARNKALSYTVEQ